ncbi:MAG TPA: FAD-dependent oxidoreductase, partial [Gammaproteobacteria bacterium]|nr:FAD-dependent oxidoreductase [Gammaproteobacteria bacterium]
MIIIGGGIHGAAVAQAASEHNIKVLVLEQFAQPGAATSSKSSKLIHGGLRYLESAQFKLVRECLDERRFLLETHPDLVKLVPFHIPVYSHTSRRPWKIRLGLALYALFSGKGFRSISRAQWPQLDGLKTDDLENVFQYYDAQTDDKKLTQRTMEQATSKGATLITGAHFDAATCNDATCEVHYHRNDQAHTITGKLLINCAGPWVNDVLDRIQPQPTHRDMELVLGTHIVVAGKLEHG